MVLFWVGIFIGFIFGAILGIALMCLLQIIPEE